VLCLASRLQPLTVNLHGKKEFSATTSAVPLSPKNIAGSSPLKFAPIKAKKNL
jgi:hypothetical protein